MTSIFIRQVSRGLLCNVDINCYFCLAFDKVQQLNNYKHFRNCSVTLQARHLANMFVQIDNSFECWKHNNLKEMYIVG